MYVKKHSAGWAEGFGRSWGSSDRARRRLVSSNYARLVVCARGYFFEGRSVAVRPHPNVGGERLFGQCPHYRAGLFRVSERPLADDLKDAFCVIYRQSSVGIQALMNGIPVIYLNVDQPLGGDPLDQAGPGWMVVEDADALRMALARVPDARRVLSLMGDASKIAERYFAAPSAALLRPFLEVSTTISRGDARSR